MDSDERLIAKIRALLAKTTQRGATEAEAAEAYAKAQRLLAEHNLDMAAVRASDAADAAAREAASRWDHESRTRPFRGDVPDDWIRAATVVNTYFGVRVLVHTDLDRGERVLLFFGPPVNVETAKWTFRSLLAAFDRLWSDHVRACPWGVKGDRATFVGGVTDGFMAKCREEREAMDRESKLRGGPGTALALLDIDRQLDAHLDGKYPRRGTVSAQAKGSGRDAVYGAGFDAGKHLTLARPLPQPGGPKALPGA